MNLAGREQRIRRKRDRGIQKMSIKLLGLKVCILKYVLSGC